MTLRIFFLFFGYHLFLTKIWLFYFANSHRSIFWQFIEFFEDHKTSQKAHAHTEMVIENQSQKETQYHDALTHSNGQFHHSKFLEFYKNRRRENTESPEI